jgi:hypothetical protein
MHREKNLADIVENLYEWYGQWMCEYPKNFQYLSLLIFLSRISSQGGNFITEPQEALAIDKIIKIREDLYEGKISHSQLGEKLKLLIQEIAEGSPKAKLVVQSKRLERAIHDLPECQESFLQRCQMLLGHILKQITPQLPDIHAIAIAKELAQILAKIKSGFVNPKELLNNMENAMQSWMPLGAD